MNHLALDKDEILQMQSLSWTSMKSVKQCCFDRITLYECKSKQNVAGVDRIHRERYDGLQHSG